MGPDELTRFASLTYDDFRRMALDESLSLHERVGFPDAYRAGKEDLILADIAAKLQALQAREKTVIDVGPGCSELPRRLADLCERQGHTLVLVDSDEMLSQLPDRPFIRKRPGLFPAEERLDDLSERGDVLLVYSVLHYVFADGNIWRFFDRLLELLAPSGALLLGDIPNVSQRKRFFATEAGRHFHREFMHTDDDPDVAFNVLEPGQIDDTVILGLVLRARLAGFDAFVLPQHPDLPMANRREDVLVTRS
jgi:hypothetical protein